MPVRLLTLLIALVMSSAALAGEVKVTWQDPDRYTDIREGHELRDSFRESLFEEMASVFAGMARQLPENCLLEVTVTDVDLAGEVNGIYGLRWQDVRVVRSIYWPRISFSYLLKDASQGLLLQGKEEISDMAFLFHAQRFARTRFVYEERMLIDWFRRQQTAGIFPVRDKAAD